MDKLIMLDDNTVKFHGVNGKLATDTTFLEKVCHINVNNYDHIYYMNGLFGAYLLLKNKIFSKHKNYRYIECGSGIPIISDTTGILEIEHA